MHLADAVEQWGISNRDRLDDSEAESVRKVWSALRDSGAGLIDLTQLEQDDASEISALVAGIEAAEAERIIETAAVWADGQPERSSAIDNELRDHGERATRLRTHWQRQDALEQRRRFGMLLAAVSGALLLLVIALLALL